MCDDCKRSNEMIVCHKLWSILWSIVHACSLTIEYRVVQFEPSINILEHFESILLTVLPRISMLLWNDGRQGMVLILCRVVESSCLPTHNIVPHICWHDPPCHKTTKRYTDFQSMVVFQLLLRKFWIQTWFCNCKQHLCLLDIVFEYSPSIHGRGMMLVLPNWLHCSVLSTSDQCFVSFLPKWCHPHTQIRIILFHGVGISVPNWKPLLPTVLQQDFLKIAFPITVLPKDDRTDFAQEERLGLPYWTMIWAICASVDVSKYLDILTLEIWFTLVHLPTQARNTLETRKLAFITSACIKHSRDERNLYLHHKHKLETLLKRESLCVHHKRTLRRSSVWRSPNWAFARKARGFLHAQQRRVETKACVSTTSTCLEHFRKGKACVF